METTHLSAGLCQKCGKSLDAHTSIEDGHKPYKGCLSVCFYCGTVGEYDEDLKIRLLSDQELEKIKDEHPDVKKELDLVLPRIKNRFAQTENISKN